MIFKIDKPKAERFYLVYNKTKDIIFNDIAIGDFAKLDKLFNKKNSIYIEGYLDKKDRLVIKREVENQGW